MCHFAKLYLFIPRLSFFLILFGSAYAWSEVGMPCPQGDECPPGQVCAPGRLAGDSPFCTRPCNADRPCPDDYVCESQGGLAMCNTPLVYSQLGEPCEPSCADGLLCLNDGAQEYCSVACTLPGSCPEGFSCRMGDFSACAIINTQPSIGEPCTEEQGCSGDYECRALGNRELSYCTYPCAEISCPSFMDCAGDGEEARCVHRPYERILGQKCVVEAFDETTLGCTAPYICERNRDHHICTQDCSVDMPCPSGFGCVDRPESQGSTIGRCMPGVESAQGLEPADQMMSMTNTSMPTDGSSLEEMYGSGGMNSNTSATNDSKDTDDSGCDTLSHSRSPTSISISAFFSLIIFLCFGLFSWHNEIKDED